ncbi:MAG: cobaltochelatase subunit CobN [Pseudomonadota bacterium]
MHLLAAEAQRIDEGEEAVDLDLSPAPIVLLSAADGEIAAFAEAVAASPDGPSVRLASLAALTHPMSVDLLAQKTLSQAKVVAVRVIGGEAFFAYGIEVLRRLALTKGQHLFVVPGEPTFDADLARRGTATMEMALAFHSYCREAGPQNRARALALLRHLAGAGEPPPPPVAVPAAGLYARGRVLGGVGALAAEMPDGPRVGLVFYRAHLMDGLTGGIDALVEGLVRRGLCPVPIFATSLKDPVAAPVVRALLAETDAGVVLTTMAFSAGGAGTPLDGHERTVLQVVQSSGAVEDWQASTAGLGVRDLAMAVVTPEFDGRVLTRASAFKERTGRDPRTGAFPVRFRPEPGRADFIAELAAAHQRLRTVPAAQKRVAFILANYPGKGGRIANGVGLDTPASTAALLARLKDAGYRLEGALLDAAALMALLVAGRAHPPARLALDRYLSFFRTLPEAARADLVETWGPPQDDPSVVDGAFALPINRFGNVVVAVQPTRGYERDPKTTYHDPALVPTHAYLAFYLHLREEFAAHAVVHVGKHGNMEWLPGKAVALSGACWPEIAFGPTPHVYPFIVNDPGEGAQGKRRAQGVIVDHLTPPMTRAENFGAGEVLEALIDEYALARALDPPRADRLASDIADLAASEGFARDLGIDLSGPLDEAIAALDAHICDLKEMQIRDGLHILGTSPTGRQRTDTLVAMARAPRGPGEGDRSLLRAISEDFSLPFDPLDVDFAAPWDGPRPANLGDQGGWRTAGDTLERLEAFAAKLVDGAVAPGTAAKPILEALDGIGRDLDGSGAAELDAVMRALDGRFVAPGPSGAPTRGRPDVLPTGRNFFAVDIRGVPTPAAWEIGSAAAERVVERYVMEEGDWPRVLVLTCWGTSNMRTGGDDLAQALAYIGAKPVWEGSRLTGFSVRPLSELQRPRIDVTLRISGFFRDAFPEQITLFDSAVRAVAARDEPADQNPIRARFESGAEGADISIFGAMPGAYGAGLQALIDTGAWDARTDLAEAYVAWGRYAYGKKSYGEMAETALRQRLSRVDALVQAQDNREHDILDSDDYYQFEGGLAAAVEAAKGVPSTSYHVDTSRAERPIVRTLGEEVARVVRGRAANPKWIAGVMRHGYKGAFEIAATVDYLFAFAATTDAVKDHHFDQLYAAYLENDEVASFIAEANRPALGEIAAKFREAIARGLWSPRKNSVHERLDQLAAMEQS